MNQSSLRDLRLIFMGLSLLLAAPAGATTWQITQSDLSFTPPLLEIAPGDTVEWHWTGGLHTVTSGSGAADPQAGTLFDAPLDASNPLYSFVFAAEGEYLYFCRPHEFADMEGIIRVNAGVGAEGESWGRVKALLAP